MEDNLDKVVDIARAAVEKKMAFYTTEAKGAVIAAAINYMAAERVGAAIVASSQKGAGASSGW